MPEPGWLMNPTLYHVEMKQIIKVKWYFIFKGSVIIHWAHLQHFRDSELQLQIRTVLGFISGRLGVSSKNALEYYIYKVCFIGSFCSLLLLDLGAIFLYFPLSVLTKPKPGNLTNKIKYIKKSCLKKNRARLCLGKNTPPYTVKGCRYQNTI